MNTENQDTKVKITYTLPISDVPSEVDRKLEDLRVRLQRIVSRMELISFREDVGMSAALLDSTLVGLESISHSVADLCSIAGGFMQIRDRQEQPESLADILESAPDGPLGKDGAEE